MATIFKTLSSDDITSTRTLLHESVPVTGTIVSGSTYSDNNIKNYSFLVKVKISLDIQDKNIIGKLKKKLN